MYTRRDFTNRLLMLAGAGTLSPLWAAMKYDPPAVLGLFRQNASETDARVRAGIEAHRKSPVTLVFKTADGRPCEQVHVKMRQLRHDFKYGANLFMLDEIPDSAEKNSAYKEMFASAFNLATLPFYWQANEPKKDRTRYGKDSPRLYRRPPPDLCLEWCEANGVEPKAHCLSYVSEAAYPAWAKGDVKWEKERLEKRFQELAARYARRIPMWEVTNETLHWTKWRRNASNFFSSSDYVEWSFKKADQYFPSNRLIINETQLYLWEQFKGSRSAYYLQIENALLKGCRIDGIGMQAHSFWGKNMEDVARRAKVQYDPNLIFELLDTYAAFGRPIQITETTIPAYSNDAGDEAVQAEILRTLYRIWFSHPAMEAIIYWNLPDGYAHGAVPGDCTKGENIYYGGLCRFDMSPKPAYNVVKDLFGREWRTNLDCVAAGGRLSFKGFHGTYELEATSNGKTVKREFHVGHSKSNDLELVI